VGERQVLVNGPHCRRPLADSGRDSLDRAGTHVANGKQAWMARLERERQAAKALPSRVQVLCPKRPVRKHKPALVEDGAARQPTRGGFRADKREQSDARQDGIAAGGLEAHCGERLIAFEAFDLSVDSCHQSLHRLQVVDVAVLPVAARRCQFVTLPQGSEEQS